MKIKEKIELAKKIADEQMEKACMELYDDSDMIWFEHDDIHVINPWLSPCSRFDLTDAEAVKEYGLANIMDFIERVASKMEK